MVDWQRKLGLIVPSWNTVNEYEVQRVAVPAMSLHTMRIKHTADTEENLVWMGTQVPGAAQLLAHAKVDVICYGCAGGGFLKGPDYDRQISRDIEEATGIPGVTSSAATVDAFRALGVERISLASPYEPWMNEKVRLYLKASGIEILAMKGLGTQAHASFTPEQNAELAAEVDRAEAQAIFISCSNFRTLEIIEPLEQRLGKPVITSNMASLWGMLRILGDRRPVAGAGRLFREA
jgi:maleate isomerase